MYGSSLRMETRRPRALRIRPTLAAVMPLPSEEVTPPVTKTYFAMGTGPPGVFPMLSKSPPDVESTLGRAPRRRLLARGRPRARRRIEAAFAPDLRATE